MGAAAIIALCLAAPSYDAAYAEAIRTGRPLVVFVGCPALTIEGAVTFATPRVSWHTGSAVIVSMPRQGASGPWLEWVETLPAMAPASQIKEAIARHARRLAPPPPTIYLHPFAQPGFGPPMRFGGAGRSC